MVEYVLDAFRRCARVDEIVLILPPDEVEQGRGLISHGPGDKTEKAVAGGDTRQASVRNGLAELSPEAELVVVHDAARPFVTPALINSCIEAAQRHGAAIAALPASDTVKWSEDGCSETRTVPREHLYLAQTPQAFRRSLLELAFQRAEAEGLTATDEASLVERMGRPVFLVAGSAENVKITTPEDLALAEAIARARAGPARSGFGYDVHRFAAGRRLVLGGVEFEAEAGLAGHSDADVLTHAVCDAVLGAIAAGDIGTHFPDTDPAWKDARSLDLLARVARMVGERGFCVVNVDATVVAERPKISPAVRQMRANLARALSVREEAVSVKATTSEGLGFVGREEGIACYAVCTVQPYYQPEGSEIGKRSTSSDHQW